VEVTVNDLRGASGSRLVAILYKGVPDVAGGDSAFIGLDSFSTDVSSSDFTVIGMIRQGDWWNLTAHHARERRRWPRYAGRTGSRPPRFEESAWN